MLQERERRHCNTVALAIPGLKQREPSLLIVAQAVIIFAMVERADGLVPEHSTDATLEVKVQRAVEH